MKKKLFVLGLGICFSFLASYKTVGRAEIISVSSALDRRDSINRLISDNSISVNWGTLKPDIQDGFLKFNYEGNSLCLPLQLEYTSEISEELVNILKTEDREILGYIENGNLMLKSIEVKDDSLKVLGLGVGLDAESAYSIQREYGKTEPVIDLVDTEFTNGFYYNNSYIEYMISEGKVISLFIRYDGNK